MSGRIRSDGRSSPVGYLREHGFWWAVTLGALTPLAWLGWRAANGDLGVDPVNTINNLSGRTAMIVLLLSLACTPLNTIFGFRKALTVRKSLGLIALVYASLHLINFVGLDYGFDFGLIFQDAVLNKPYILAGSTALLLLIPLAITSTRGWMKRLGRNWKRLHRLVYAAGVLVVLHFLWQAKAAEREEPLIYAGVLALLLIVRIPSVRRWLVTHRTRLVGPKPPRVQTMQRAKPVKQSGD
ncbi:MAG: sulfoxide reductase heme-binding subunit YedZ [Caldilineaceae bacterium]|jgi:sulfoxide reductase heme-binding subunit YedZ|nr:sulfoxide reductase heme-binding subunit YedZ [Caldilineaceae bacterium]